MSADAIQAVTAERDQLRRELELLQRTVEHERDINRKIADRAERLFSELATIRAEIGGAK